MTEPESVHDIMSKVSADMFCESNLRKMLHVGQQSLR